MGARTSVPIQRHTPSGLLPPAEAPPEASTTSQQPIKAIDGLISQVDEGLSDPLLPQAKPLNPTRGNL